MPHELTGVTGYLPNIHNDIYCAYKSSLNRKIWHAQHQRTNYSRFYYILDGVCRITINDIEYTATKNHLILIPANSDYSYSIADDNTMVKLWCHFNSMVDGTSLFDLITCNYLVKPADPVKMETLFQELIKTFPNSYPIISQLRQQALLSEILMEFLQSGSYRMASPGSENRMELDRIITYMETHLSEKITISRLASLAHMNANYFIQVFTKTYGTSPLKMLNQIKLENIRQSLEKTDDPISEIALRMGFDDISYFSKFTKKYLGFSPRDYRLYIKNGNDEQAGDME